MPAIEYLAVRRVDRAAHEIRRIVMRLQRCRQSVAQAGASPQRNPSFDQFMGELNELRQHLTNQVRRIIASPNSEPVETHMLAQAIRILADISNLIELLIWLGGRLPEDSPASASGFQ
jgi:hypothetical protein